MNRERLDPYIWRVGSVVILAFLATFYVVYHVTASRLRGQLDTDLVREAQSFEGRISPRGVELTSRGVADLAAHYVADQPFSAAERLLYVIVPGRGIVTNYPELLGQTARDTDDTPATARAEARLSAALRAQPPGFSIQGAPDAGRVRLYVEAFRTEDGLDSRIGVAEPLAANDEALDGITRAFAIGGTLKFKIVG